MAYDMAIAMKLSSQQHIECVEQYSAHNYHPLPLVISEAQGVWMHDAEGNRYFDMLSAYSALNFGHRHPELIAVAKHQLDRITLTSRAMHNDQLGSFCKALAELCNMDAVLPMNTGAEAVETAIKTARKWGYKKRGIPSNAAKIICCDSNFHGRTTTILSFSTDAQARGDFGPFTPGFHTVPFGDSKALEEAIDRYTVAFLFEPVQGEAGVIIPPVGYLKEVRRICSERNILMIADEIQSGLGRIGDTFACQHEQVQPDIYILGKALGGGIVPISAIACKWDVMGVFLPGDHGSTFGGNPLACAIALKVIELLRAGIYQKNARELGHYMLERLQNQKLSKVARVRGKGLWAGIDVKKEAGRARKYCEELLEAGVVCKDTHEQTIRLAPPLCVSREELDWALERIEKVLA
jgi:ornithine--oxo-acid transaminase